MPGILGTGYPTTILSIIYSKTQSRYILKLRFGDINSKAYKTNTCFYVQSTSFNKLCLTQKLWRWWDRVKLAENPPTSLKSVLWHVPEPQIFHLWKENSNFLYTPCKDQDISGRQGATINNIVSLPRKVQSPPSWRLQIWESIFLILGHTLHPSFLGQNENSQVELIYTMVVN